MRNALLDASALDIDKKPDIDPNSLLAWLRSQGNVEDRRKPYAGGPYTPNVNDLMNYNGTLGPRNDFTANMPPQWAIADMVSGRNNASPMPWNGAADADWRKDMSHTLQTGRDPADERMFAELQSGKFPEQGMTREELEAIIEKYRQAYRDSLPGGSDADLPSAPAGPRSSNADIMNEMLR